MFNNYALNYNAIMLNSKLKYKNLHEVDVRVNNLYRLAQNLISIKINNYVSWHKILFLFKFCLNCNVFLIIITPIYHSIM